MEKVTLHVYVYSGLQYFTLDFWMSVLESTVEVYSTMYGTRHLLSTVHNTVSRAPLI